MPQPDTIKTRAQTSTLYIRSIQLKVTDTKHEDHNNFNNPQGRVL